MSVDSYIVTWNCLIVHMYRIMLPHEIGSIFVQINAKRMFRVNSVLCGGVTINRALFKLPLTVKKKKIVTLRTILFQNHLKTISFCNPLLLVSLLSLSLLLAL